MPGGHWHLSAARRQPHPLCPRWLAHERSPGQGVSQQESHSTLLALFACFLLQPAETAPDLCLITPPAPTVSGGLACLPLLSSYLRPQFPFNLLIAPLHVDGVSIESATSPPFARFPRHVRDSSHPIHTAPYNPRLATVYPRKHSLLETVTAVPN